MIVYAVVDDALSPDFPLGDSLEVFVRREDAEQFIEECAATTRGWGRSSGVVERELEVGGPNYMWSSMIDEIGNHLGRES